VPEVTIRLLGGFAALVDDAPVPDRAWRLNKARELVKLLALAPGHRLHREQAMDVLWRDRDPSAAANNLNQAVHFARRALGAEAIEVRQELLVLDADVDVERLEQAAADARRSATPAAYRAALSLYGGVLLAENRYDDWAQERREELAALYDALAAELAELPPEDPLHRLPAATSSFVGRTHELTELRALLAGTRLLTLAGTGGAGKTRLALELARAVEQVYPDGAVVVELAPVFDPRLVAAAAATALDVRALPGRPVTEAVVDFLAPRTLLLVVDNCEHVLGASAALADELLRAAPGLAVVATSREPLRIAGEVVFRVPSLAIPDPEEALAPDRLLGYEAVRLFVDRATAAAPSFRLDERNAADVARICIRLDGLPLALELAAGRLGALGAGVVAERLDDRFRVLRAGSRTAPTRQQTLEATLQWSHDLLEADEQLLFRRLAVFAGGFDLEAVEAVCAGGGLDRDDVVDVLARLVEKSLVARDGQRRYRLLETVRLYARQRLEEAGEGEALADRHSRWALELAEREDDRPELDPEEANFLAALDTLRGRSPLEALRLCVALWTFWLRRIDLAEAYRRFDDALAAVPERTAFRARALLAAAALEARGGAPRQSRAHAEESLSIATEVGDPRAEWRALHFLGSIAIAYDVGNALAWLDGALELARREGFAPEQALGIYSLAVAHWFLGDAAGAEELMEAGIEAFRNLPSGAARVPTPTNVAEMRLPGVADPRGFRVVLEDSVQPFVEVSCEAALSYALVNQAGIVRERGDFGRARELLDESAARFLAAGDERGQADVLVRRAYLHRAEGALDDASDCLDQALAYRRRANDRRGIGLVLAALGMVDTDTGDHRAAERRLAEASDLFRRAGDRWGLVISLFRTADLAVARGRLDEACAALEEAELVLRETDFARWNAHVFNALAEVALLQGDGERAAGLFADARERYVLNADAASVAAVDERMGRIANPPLSERKGGARITTADTTRKGRKR
jgi:predicted ATPase